MAPSINNWLHGNYLNLSTKKKDGSWVNTPVWFAYDGKQYLYCFSETKAGKVKRLRNFSEAKINPCTVTGKILGEWQEVKAEILPATHAKAAYLALLKSYGWQLRILNIFSFLAGKINKRTFIRISLAER